MLSKRVIPCLDVRAGRLTKGIKLELYIYTLEGFLGKDSPTG